MKKLFFLFVITTFLASCSSDDDGSNGTDDNPNENTPELIIGSWKMIEAQIVYTNGDIEAFSLPTCADMNVMIFEENNDFDYIMYTESQGNCELAFTSIDGYWVRNSPIVYSIYLNYHEVDDETSTGVILTSAHFFAVNVHCLFSSNYKCVFISFGC
ncbi:MAG TPA: lipoprotein [Flavobacteriaceae bacterium]|nr:lipoprotein [Flavobacteriaceae bacterium]